MSTRRHAAAGARGPLPTAILLALSTTAEGKAPSEFRIFSYGVNTSDKGDFVFDEKSAETVMEAFRQKVGASGARLTMDYEHQAFSAPKNGQPAPASAYSWTPAIRANEAGKPELWATDVKWTERATQYIESHEYNYFSPAFEIDKSKRVVTVANMALTNIPAMDGQAPLIAASRGEDPMKCTKCSKALDGDDSVMCSSHMTASAAGSRLLVMLGLAADADDTTLVLAAQEAINFRAETFKLLGAKNPVEALGAVNALKGKETELVELRSRVATDAQKALDAEWDRVLDQAGKEGKLAPDPAIREKFTGPLLALSQGKVTRDAITFATNHFATLEAKVTVTDKNGNGGHTEPADKEIVQLTAADVEIARRTGIAQVDIIEHKKKVAARKYVAGVERPLTGIILG